MDNDPLSIQAIIELQLEDSRDAINSTKGKQREGTLTDAEAALQVHMDDLEKWDAILQDRKMAQSIALAVLQDTAFLAEAQAQEMQIAEDREIAAQLAAGNAYPSANHPVKDPRGHNEMLNAKNELWEDQQHLDKAAAIYMQCPDDRVESVTDKDEDGDSDGTVAESSAWAASRKERTKIKHATCIACNEEKLFYEVARVPCGHEYCRPCLETLFVLSMQDESLFPPRCDKQEIPLSQVRGLLSSEVAKEFEDRYEELSTTNRTYCHERSCSTFIPTKNIEGGEGVVGEIATCPACSRTTCISCKNASHDGDCLNDEALQQLIITANARQWQRCYKCKRFVELNHGCNHMTCPCGAQFCYVCGQIWGICGCPQWNEERLLERAQEIVDRDPNRRLFQPQRRVHPQPATRPPSPVVASQAVAGPSSVRATALPRHSRRLTSSSDTTVDHNARLASDHITAPQLEPGSQRNVEIPSRDGQVADVIEYLRNNHECSHDEWHWVRGRHQCEECRDVLKVYIFECARCHLQECNRCRLNRF